MYLWTTRPETTTIMPEKTKNLRAIQGIQRYGRVRHWCRGWTVGRAQTICRAVCRRSVGTPASTELIQQRGREGKNWTKDTRKRMIEQLNKVKSFVKSWDQAHTRQNMFNKAACPPPILQHLCKTKDAQQWSEVHKKYPTDSVSFSFRLLFVAMLLRHLTCLVSDRLSSTPWRLIWPGFKQTRFFC